jgi:hypothetical protein
MTGAQQDTLEDRVAKLEALVARAIERGRRHPLGRQVIRLLGLEDEG